MGQRRDFEHVSDLVRKCAETMRLISRSKLDDLGQCPFRQVVLQLEQLSDEIRGIAASLPAEWGEAHN